MRYDDRVKRFVVPAFVLASVAACAAESESPKNSGAECSSDANCSLGAWTADCCPRCKPFGATNSEVAAMDDRCRSITSPVSARCPELKCPPNEGPDYIPKCVAGRCVVGP